MKRVFGIGFLAIVAAMSMGCSASTQCMRQVNELSATAQEQERQIRDLEGRVAVVRAEQAGTTLSALASESWDATVGAFGWVKKEAPIAGQAAANAYNDATTRMSKAQKCYQDNGGGDAHTYEEYRAIASKCLGDN